MAKTTAEVDLEQPFVAHLMELRDRILRMVVAVVVVLLALFPFANDLYVFVAAPLMRFLPEGSSMIATQVASPFLAPFKLTLVASVFVSIPFILYQFWGFVAPGLYRHEKRLVIPLLVSSTLLFYLGMLFAYYLVFPLIFGFLTSTAPQGVAVMTDISHYLDFVLTLFFAFGVAFEVPIATILLVWMGVTTPDQLIEQRPYVIVGAFIVGMFLTPPDVFSQTLLAVPMWLLFEAGVFFSRYVLERRREDEALEPEVTTGFTDEPEAVPVAAAVPSRSSEASSIVDPERYVPMTDEAMEAELDAIEAREAQSKAERSNPQEEKLKRVMALREMGNDQAARKLLYELLEEGNADQRTVARNILQQLDD